MELHILPYTDSPAFPHGDSLNGNPILDPGTELGDNTSSVVSLHRHLSDYDETRDESAVEKGYSAGECEKQLSGQGNLDKMGLQYTL